MPSYVDLHIHTNHSDGSDSPERVVERAAAAGFAAIAVTDHDTVSGVLAAQQAAAQRGLECLAATEISASYGRLEIHVVGLGVQLNGAALAEALTWLQGARSRRVDAILERLKTLGVDVARAEVEALGAPGSALGRVHIARALYARGVTRTVQHGFDKYLRAGRKAYVPREMLPCRKAVDLIHEAGGLAILAHPGVGRSVQRLLARLLDLGFDGIEAYHTQHTPGQTTQFVQVATDRDLLVSGGSDCHGVATGGPPDLGKVRVPYHHYERILDALQKRERER